ncbi:MAG TPA: flagellar assembly protein FliW [Candidatus Baltobacteraceae bacterium]|nr:flagellar assembly protein FliW [Candidatus Baltobacteraceae bacterium]
MQTTMESPAEMTIVTSRFGDVTFQETDVFEFPWGLPGFADQRRFLALSLAEQPSFVWLQSIDDPNLALPAADPWRIFQDYEPRIPAYATEALALQNPEDFTILCVVVVTKEAEEMTMNLMAPIVVNLKTRRARQVMLENSPYAVRTPIPRKHAEVQGTAQPA